MYLYGIVTHSLFPDTYGIKLLRYLNSATCKSYVGLPETIFIFEDVMAKKTINYLPDTFYALESDEELNKYKLLHMV